MKGMPHEESAIPILRKRAEELAAPLAQDTGGVDLAEILEFTLGHERYAFRTQYVREVFPLADITPIPGLPAYVLGVVNVRGRILSVMDIRRLLEFEHVGLTNLNKAIILHHGQMEVAVLADEIAGVYQVDMAETQPSLPTLSGRAADFLEMVTRDQVAVLNAEKLLDPDKIVVRDLS